MHFPLSQVQLLHCPILGNAELQNRFFQKKSDFAQIIIDSLVESPVIRWPHGRVGLDFAHHKVPNFSAFVYKGEVPGQIEARK